MAYLSDLKTEEWQLIEKFFEPTDKRGSQSKYTKQQVVNAIMYVVRTGVQWRYKNRAVFIADMRRWVEGVSTLKICTGK